MSDLPFGFISIDTVISDSSPEAVKVLVSYSKYFSKRRITDKNVGIFIKLISTNYPEVVDSLLAGRNPSSFLSTLIPSRELIISLLDILGSQKPLILFYKTTLMCLGGLNQAYSPPEQGMGLYQLSVSNVYHVAKFLVVDNNDIKLSVLDFLDKLKNLTPQYDISTISAKIIDTYHDSAKQLDNIIPYLLLK